MNVTERTRPYTCAKQILWSGGTPGSTEISWKLQWRPVRFITTFSFSVVGTKGGISYDTGKTKDEMYISVRIGMF